MINAIITLDFNIMPHIKYVLRCIDINNDVSRELMFAKSDIFAKEGPLLLDCVI